MSVYVFLAAFRARIFAGCMKYAFSNHYSGILDVATLLKNTFRCRPQFTHVSIQCEELNIQNYLNVLSGKVARHQTSPNIHAKQKRKKIKERTEQN